MSGSTGENFVKASTRAQWDKAAAGWNAHASEIRAWLEAATDAMLGMAGVAEGSRVLDVAAGAGEQTLAIAQRVGPRGFVLATDLSAAILALARDNAAHARFTNVQTQVADGEDLQVEAAGFDAAVCRLGLMLFPQPLRGLQEIHRALRPGAGVCTVVFSGPERNPCIAILMSSALKHAGLPARDPYLPGGLLSLGRPGLTDELFKAAGFQDVATTTMAAPFRLPSVEHYLDFVRASASPIQQLLDRLDKAAADAAWAEIRQRLSAFETPAGWEGPNELLLTAGRRR
ncbi:MAG: methyltransferase domain-containing protein [Rubrivivax sp.]|nr:methyltransferase domain-containing protein [Rubrivivax sp.]